MKFFPWGHINAPVGVAPEALEEWEHSSKGCEHNVCMVDWVLGPLSVRFSRPRHYFSRHRCSFQLVGRPSSLANQCKQLTERARGHIRHAGLHRRAMASLFEGTALSRGARGAPEPQPVWGPSRGPSSYGYDPRSAFPQGGGVKRAMLPLPGRRAMNASVSF